MRPPESTVTRKALPPYTPSLSGHRAGQERVVLDEQCGFRRILWTAIVMLLLTGLGLVLMGAAIDHLAQFPLTRLSGFF
jgi:hypothetical protein